MNVTYPGAVPPERRRTVTSLGLRLHVVEWGDPAAQPVLLLHGFYDHVHAFDLMAPLLARRYRVVAYDARGHGDSEWPDAYAWQTDVLDAVNVLRDSHEALSRRFATTRLDKFDGLPFVVSPMGLPLLDDALAHVECTTVRTYPEGDHTIFLGRVERAVARSGSPLVYFRGQYQRLASPA